jgi:hypothetical protein
MPWTKRILEALALVVAIAVVGPVVVGLHGPLLPSLVALCLLIVIVKSVFRGPHVKK